LGELIGVTTKKKNKKTSPDTGHGTCKICGKRQASEKCTQCHQYVCRDCYFALVGICQQCISKSTAKKWKQRKIDWEKKLGVEWID